MDQPGDRQLTRAVTAVQNQIELTFNQVFSVWNGVDERTLNESKIYQR